MENPLLSFLLSSFPWILKGGLKDVEYVKPWLKSWVLDIQGALSVMALAEYLEVWELIMEVQLRPNTCWCFSCSSGLYSTKLAYKTLFIGSISFEPCELIWRTWAPKKCQFFLWPAAHNRCWTADWLAPRGLPHPDRCPLCDQDAENIHHILFNWVFSRQVWLAGCSSFVILDWWITPLPQSPRR